jgi:hypothetical protein
MTRVRAPGFVARIPLGLWLILGAGFVQFLVLPTGYVGKEHDDALYVLAAESLAEGRYRFLQLPGAPRITTLTPGLPVLLLPVAWLWSGVLFAYQAYSWLLLALCNGAVWMWLRTRHPRPVALAAALLFALNPLVLSRSGAVMPEAAYLLLSMATLLLWERRSAGGGLGLGLLASYAIRPAAWPLGLAIWVGLAIKRRFKDLILACLVSGVGALAWAVWSRSSGGVQEIRELDALYSGALSDVFKIAAANARRAAETWGSTFLPLHWADGPAAPALGALLFALTLAGLFRSKTRWREGDAATYYLAFSLLMHLAWPWWYDRYLLPLLPLLLSFALSALPRSWARTRETPLALGLALTVFLQFTAQGRLWVRTDHHRLQPRLWETYQWIRSHTAPTDMFVSPFYGRDLLYTGRPFGPLPSADTAEDLRDRLQKRRVRYVLWEEQVDAGFSLPAENPVARLLARQGPALQQTAFFQPMYHDSRTGTWIFQVKNPPAK